MKSGGNPDCRQIFSYDLTEEITLTFADASDLSGASYIGDDGTLQKLEPLILRQTDRSVTFRAELPIFKPFLILCHSQGS